MTAKSARHAGHLDIARDLLDGRRRLDGRCPAESCGGPEFLEAGIVVDETRHQCLRETRGESRLHAEDEDTRGPGDPAYGPT